MARLILTFFFLNSYGTFAKADAEKSEQGGLIGLLENKLENKFASYATDITKWLASWNDKHLNNSELGKLLRYNELKPKFEEIGNEARGMKKLSMAMLPIIFHVGALSTWIILTAMLAAKSVAIGTILLVFKIAVSSAKMASFFSAWKQKHDHEHIDFAWHPHHEHHDIHHDYDHHPYDHIDQHHGDNHHIDHHHGAHHIFNHHHSDHHHGDYHNTDHHHGDHHSHSSDWPVYHQDSNVYKTNPSNYVTASYPDISKISLDDNKILDKHS